MSPLCVLVWTYSELCEPKQYREGRIRNICSCQAVEIDVCDLGKLLLQKRAKCYRYSTLVMTIHAVLICCEVPVCCTPQFALHKAKRSFARISSVQKIQRILF
jgi:hypothetical protein